MYDIAFVDYFHLVTKIALFLRDFHLSPLCLQIHVLRLEHGRLDQSEKGFVHVYRPLRSREVRLRHLGPFLNHRQEKLSERRLPQLDAWFSRG